MNTYIKFLTFNFIKSIIYVFSIILSLIIILNVLTEIEFFKNYNVKSYLPAYLAALNSLDLVFEIFPFIFLIATQIFFLNLFSNNQISIFKYSGLKNSKIVSIISIVSFFIGLLIVTFFYGLSSNLKNLYLDYKNKYTNDNKYLAVVTNNGLWIKDLVKKKRLIINAATIEGRKLKGVNISEFDENFNLLRIITSEDVDISFNQWILNNAKMLKKDETLKKDKLTIYSNFDYKKINNLFSNLSSLSILELLELRENYKKINYSTTEIDTQLHKLTSYPIYFVLMTILSSIIMLNFKKSKNISFKIIVGLFFCVIIYYVNNLFQVLGNTGKLPLILSVWITLIFLFIVNFFLLLKVNEK